jgi:hypothetical protein
MSDELLEALQQQRLLIETQAETPTVARVLPSEAEELRADALFSEPSPLTAVAAVQLGVTAVSLIVDNHRVVPEAKPRLREGKDDLDNDK